MRSTVYINNNWLTIPQEGGNIPGTTLQATWMRDEKDGFKFTKLALVNTGDRPVKLGSCHIIELDVLQGLKKAAQICFI